MVEKENYFKENRIKKRKEKRTHQHIEYLNSKNRHYKQSKKK
jgi:hypothetical protein